MVHHHKVTDAAKVSGRPNQRPVPKPSRSGPCRTSAATQATIHSSHRHAATRVPAFGNSQARSQTRATARLQLVADTSAMRTPMMPVVCRKSPAPRRACCSCSSEVPLRPNTVRSESSSWSRTAGGAKAATANSSGIRVRNVWAANRVAASSRAGENRRAVSSVITGKCRSASARARSKRVRCRASRFRQRSAASFADVIPRSSRSLGPLAPSAARSADGLPRRCPARTR